MQNDSIFKIKIKMRLKSNKIFTTNKISPGENEDKEKKWKGK